MIKGYSTYKHFRNHSWLARGRGAKPWDHNGLHTPSYQLSLCATHQKQQTLSEKLNTLEKNTNRHTRYSLTQKDDSAHTQKQPRQPQK